jgi:hypothetical protein
MSKALGKKASTSSAYENMIDRKLLQMPYLLVRQALLLK